MGPFWIPQGATSWKYNLESTIEIFVATQTRQNDDFRNQKLHTNEVLMQLTTKNESMSTHNKMMEIEIFQIELQQVSLSRFFFGSDRAKS